MIRAAMTALLAMTMAGCGSDGPAVTTNTPRPLGCDAGEVAVEQPTPALPKCVATDGGADDDASAPATQ